MESVNNNIIKQIFEDEKLENKNNQMFYVQEIIKIYYNSLNNEEGEKAYLNNEDPRIITGPTYLKTNEIGMPMINPKIRIGGCKRELFFKILGTIKEEKELNEVETIERNDFIKKQWLNKFNFLHLLKEHKNHNGEEKIFGIPFRTNEKYYIKNYEKDKEYTLLIKPVNDTAYSVKDLIWPSNNMVIPQPMMIHLTEAILTMYFYKQPVLLLYVGKNNTELYQEFYIGSKNGKITINGNIFEGLNILDLKTEIENTFTILKKNMIPPRDFYMNYVLDNNTINDMFDFKIINERTTRELLNGKQYTDFKCSICKYKSICEEIGDGWKEI